MSGHSPLYFKNRLYYVLLAAGGLVALAGMFAVYLMEHHGHVITGMNNQVVWGLPHVFAIFLIVAASGVLNVASIGSVFGKSIYKARAPMASLLSIAMLAGGLAVLMLDLGRPDRLMVAATNINLTSVFAWNVVLYTGMFSLIVIYLWTMMERRMNGWNKPAGLAVFAWRFILTTGTGLIFAFLTARQAYGSAILPPMFIVLSFAWGLAVFHLVQAATYAWNDRQHDPAIMQRTKHLLGIFVIGSLYLVTVYHLTNLYFAQQVGFVRGGRQAGLILARRRMHAHQCLGYFAMQHAPPRRAQRRIRHHANLVHEPSSSLGPQVIRLIRIKRQISFQ